MRALLPLIPLGLCASTLAQPAAPDAAVPIDAAFPAGLEWQALSGDGRSVETRLGTLTLERGPQCAETREPINALDLKLAGNTFATIGCTLDGDYYIIHFRNRFEHGDTDLVLFSADAGGSGSPPPRLHLIVLSPGTEPRVLMDPEFRSSDWTQRVASDGRELWLDLGFRDGSLKRAHFDGETFTIDYVPVPQARCENAYQTLADCQSRGRGEDFSGLTLIDMLRTRESMSLASIRALRNVSQHPGFDGDAYVRTCAALIETGAMPEFTAFETAVCSSENAAPSTGERSAN
jgi:hypothetical protein